MSEIPEGWNWITIPELQINSDFALRFKQQVEDLLSQHDSRVVKLLHDDITFRSILKKPLDDIPGELFPKISELIIQYKLLFWVEVLGDEERKEAIRSLPVDEQVEMMRKIADSAWWALWLILFDQIEKFAKIKK